MGGGGGSVEGTGGRATGQKARGTAAAPSPPKGKSAKKGRPRKVKIVEATPPGSFVLEFDRIATRRQVIQFLFKDAKLPPGASLESGDSSIQWKLEINASAIRKLKKKARAIRKRFDKLVVLVTRQVFFHVHESHLDLGGRYPTDDWFDRYIEGPSVLGGDGPTRWNLINITIQRLPTVSRFRKEFKRSLDKAGAVVIYFGHTLFINNQAFGLIPAPIEPPRKFRSRKEARSWLKRNNGVPNRELRAWLGKAKAKIVLLASCQSDACVRALSKNQTLALIATDSGEDKVTNFLVWEDALREFLDVLSGYDISEKTGKASIRAAGAGTVDEALKEANKVFIGEDEFVWISGDRKARITS